MWFLFYLKNIEYSFIPNKQRNVELMIQVI